MHYLKTYFKVDMMLKFTQGNACFINIPAGTITA